MQTHELDFKEVYSAFQPKILRYMARMVSEEEAEDLTQEVFVKVSLALNTYRGDASLCTWIYRIATNTALDRLRSPSFQKVDSFALSEHLMDGSHTLVKEDKPPVEKQLVREEMNDCIRRYIERIPRDYRTVLVMSEYEGLRNNEIAAILDISLNTVKIRLHRAKEKLKKELEEHCEFYWIEEMPCSMK